MGRETLICKSHRRLEWGRCDSRRHTKEVEMVWPHPLRPDWRPHLFCSPFLSLETSPGFFLLPMAKALYPDADNYGFESESRRTPVKPFIDSKWPTGHPRCHAWDVTLGSSSRCSHMKAITNGHKCRQHGRE